jgi:ABC transport system ATP-binding/permease protein
MNRGLFHGARELRERGGIPVPAAVMPLRYAYEAMIVSQAVRNPFEVERIRLQRRIDRVRHLETPMDAGDADRFELAKEGLRRLLAAGAADKQEAADLVARIRRISSSGTRIEVETMKVWPDENPKARPASEFFVNERIDLLVREAETFRNDYRNKERRIVFHSLKKPLPWSKEPVTTTSTYVEPTGEVETQKFCGFVLVIIVFACGVIATIVISRQNRQTR